MPARLPLALLTLLSVPAACTADPPHPDLTTDVLVVDSTPAGIAAAVAAARGGRRVVLATEDRHVGGMQSSGLGNTNAGQREAVGGLAREFHDRVKAYYVKKYGAESPQAKDCSDGFHFEPHVAETVYRDWLAEAGVTVLTGEPVEAVKKEGPRLISARTTRGRTVTAAVFIDASYEGDLLKAAGCSYRVGREGTAEYNEPLAGVRFPPAEFGKADDRTQAFDYRVCLTDDPANRVPLTKPAGYDPKKYALFAAKLRQKPPASLREVYPLNKMPNRKTDSRTGEWVGASWAYPEAGREERLRIARDHRAYAEGHLWFLLTDEAVPKAVREEMAAWGLARDEFADNGHWPYHMYVREARRLVGDWVMAEKDATTDRLKPDAVAVGCFYLDVHPVRLVPAADAVGGVVEEGGIGNVRVKPYDVPYRVLLPRKAECTNLLVPVCCSASHVAYSTLRMEPVYMALGHAAGAAAALALDRKVGVHDLPADALRAELMKQKAVFDAAPFTREWPYRR